jgi:hypothetical protein
MCQVPLWRLYFLRAVYLLLAVGGSFISWAEILDPAASWKFMNGVVVCMLGALSLLALLGVRYPLQMLPLLFWEISWKLIWLLRIALPAWRSGHIDPAVSSNLFSCVLVILVIAAVPWSYVWRHYLSKPGDPWRPADPKAG